MVEPGSEYSPRYNSMNLQILIPTEVLLTETVVKITAQAENGTFCLLPRHIDFVSALVPGILCFSTEDGKENYAAIDEGILVKCGRDVSVSTLNSVLDTNLDNLQTLVEERFLELDEHERSARSALARLEAGTLRGFRELQERSHD